VAATHDIIVIGSSAGGIEALQRVLAPLPVNLPASVFVCQHQANSERPLLVDVLKRSTPLRVGWAAQGERLEHGRVYVAPPDLHMMFADDHLSLRRGPRENFARPSIDRLFRSSAAQHADRTIAVVLTGTMHDGVAGAVAVRDAGGKVIVEDPNTAAFPELPLRTLAALQPDATLPAEAIATTLLAMIREPVKGQPPPERIVRESELDRTDIATPEQLDALGSQSPVKCPECNGPLWILGPANARRWRCYVGHAVGSHELLERNRDEIEFSIWSTVRAFNERIAALEELGVAAAQRQQLEVATDYANRARELRTERDSIQRVLENMLKLVR
jgi:two-component system, chemotaxis family, protein-glutamate methylesterase/glutaminase